MEVSVASGLAQGSACPVNVRPADRPFRDDAGQIDAEPGELADARESGRDRDLRIFRRSRSQRRRRSSSDLFDVQGPNPHEMPVDVPHPGHQGGNAHDRRLCPGWAPFNRTRIGNRGAVDHQGGVLDRIPASGDQHVRFDPEHRRRNRGRAQERSGAGRHREPYGSVPVPAAMAGFAPPEVVRALDIRFPDALEYTRRLLRQPSVSATGEGIRECSELVRQMMADLGCKTRTWSKGGHPLVIGELDVGAPVTLIVYEMYDVQPVGDLNAWQAPPFAAEIRDLPGVGRAVIGRGSTNSKGALANHLFTWKTIRDVDEMPVNLKILAEGEEEISSANFIAYIRTHRRELKADAAIANDYSEDLRGVPTIYLGVKGCLYLTVWSRGNPRAGGPMDSEIHSSNAVWIGSPVWRLLQALSTLVDENQRPAIDGIWDDVVPPTKLDSAMVKTLAKTFDPSAWLQEERTAKFKFDLPKDELLLQYLFEPTVNICGIYSGYIEHGGTKTVLPHEAYAKIDIRLVKDMTVEGTLRKLRAHLKKRGYDDLRIEVHGPYGPAKTDPESWIAKAAIEAVEANGKQPEVWPSSGGTMPAFAFDEYLKLPWVSMGLGHGSRAHAPNEYASIDGMKRFMAGEATLLYAAAKRAPKRPR